MKLYILKEHDIQLRNVSSILIAISNIDLISSCKDLGVQPPVTECFKLTTKAILNNF